MKKIPELWPQGKDLKLINRDKFDPEQTMKNLGWGSLNPTSEGEVIKQRQDSLKILMSSQKLREFVKSTNLSSAPVYGRNFFNIYGKESEFMQKATVLERLLQEALSNSREELTTSLHTDLLSIYSADLASAKSREESIVSVVLPEIEKVYSYTGVVKFKTSKKEGHIEVEKTINSYGYRDYAFREVSNAVTIAARLVIEQWNKLNLKSSEEESSKIVRTAKMVLLSPLYLLSMLVMSYVEKNKNDVMYTDKAPVVVIKELSALNEKFTSVVRDNFVRILESLNIQKTSIRDAISLQTEFQFTLNPELGFRARLIDAAVTLDKESLKESGIGFKVGVTMQKDSFLNGMFFKEGVSFYSFIQKTIFEYKAERLAIHAAIKAANLPLKTAYERALIESRELLENGKDTMAQETYHALMDEVKYSNVFNAIEGVGFDKAWQEVNAFRSAVVKLISELNTIALLAEKVLIAQKKFSNLPFCFPKVLSDEKNIVSFKQLAPIHLLGRKSPSGDEEIGSSNLRLITGLPELNGRIISITGQNGGGKTATEVELINSLYLAHAGLPVFAADFEFNAKEVIAMVFVEKGEGSMLQLLMKKLTVIAEEVKSNPTNKIVVVIDELLTGTQEDTGFDIGKRYLAMLAKSGCSVLFVTQITALAQYAQNSLNSACFYFDEKGKLKPGIGKGNAQLLAEQVGLSQYL